MKMAAARQAPMHMAMMQGMMGMPPAMQMAMMHQMGMPPPPYMQHPMRPPPHMMFGSEGPHRSSKRRRGGGGGGSRGYAASPGVPEGAASSSSSSSSDSSDDDSNGGLPHPAAMAAMAQMWPGAPPPAPHMMPHGPVPHGADGLEAFLSMCALDPEAVDRVRALPPHLQQAVMSRGLLTDTRNPSAVLLARVRDAEHHLGRADGGGDYGGGPPPPVDILDDAPQPARRSAKLTIETMIRDYRLSPGCAWMLRALPPDKQKLAARIDPAGQADPSGYVAEQMKKIV